MSNTIETKPKYIDIKLEEAQKAYDQAHSDGSIESQERMLQLALNIIVLLMRKSRNHDQEYINNMVLTLNENVKKVQDTHNPHWAVALTLTSSIMNVGAGVLGFLPFGNFAVPLVNKFKTATKGLNAVATGVDGFNKLSDGHHGGKRTIHQYHLEENKRRRDDRDNSSRQSENRQKETLRDAKEAANALHQAAQQVLAQ